MALAAGLLPAATGGRPNILFIVTDDLNTQTLRDGSPVRVPTPHPDRLRQRGVSFHNGHRPVTRRRR